MKHIYRKLLHHFDIIKHNAAYSNSSAWIRFSHDVLLSQLFSAQTNKYNLCRKTGVIKNGKRRNKKQA